MNNILSWRRVSTKIKLWILSNQGLSETATLESLTPILFLQRKENSLKTSLLTGTTGICLPTWGLYSLITTFLILRVKMSNSDCLHLSTSFKLNFLQEWSSSLCRILEIRRFFCIWRSAMHGLFLRQRYEDICCATRVFNIAHCDTLGCVAQRLSICVLLWHSI